MLESWTRHLAEGEQADAVDLLAGGTLISTWVDRWRRYPGRRAIFSEATGWKTNRQLDADTLVAAASLAHDQLKSGDRLLISARASYRLVVVYVAALRLGLVVVPANVAYTARELLHVARDADISGAILDEPARRDWILEELPGVRARLVNDEWGPPPADIPRLDEVNRDDPALIMYTSGTTGSPKGAVISHGNALASVAAVELAWRWTESDRLILCLPLFHAHGLAVGLHGSLYAGCSIVLLQGFDVDAVYDAIEAHSATMFFGVPTMYSRLAASSRIGLLRRLRVCISGSAPLSPATWLEIAEKSDQRVIERYGMTETLMNVSNPFDGVRKPGTVGIPLPGVEVAIAGNDPRTGEILVRGPNVFGGYWRSSGATDESFTEDGWFRTGDVGLVDDDGYLSIVGRTKELIITGGYNVYPREIEDVIAAHPSVRDAAVVGIPSAEWGETVTAFLQLEPGSDLATMSAIAALAERDLASYKRPREWHVVDSIPRNALGKVLRHALVHSVGTRQPQLPDAPSA
jgi:malonyl-CoA/methylmalonyl-CoA synthetase